LPDYFQSTWPLINDYVFATHKSKNSNRPVLTIKPTAEALELKLKHSFKNKEFKDLAKELSDDKYDKKGIIICWHHGKIPALAKALGLDDDQLPVQKWPEDVFDEVWELEYHKDSIKVKTHKQNIDMSKFTSTS